MCRRRHLSRNTEAAYRYWARRVLDFLDGQVLETAGVVRFLDHLASVERVAASTHLQALHAALFLFRQALGREVGRLEGLRTMRRPARWPVVVTVEEVRAILNAMHGMPRLVAHCCTARACASARRWRCGSKTWTSGWARSRCGPARARRTGWGSYRDDFAIRCPAWCCAVGTAQARRPARRRHAPLPDALARKYPSASRAFGWQFLFASSAVRPCPRTGHRLRWHLSPSTVQEAFHGACQATGCHMQVSLHVLRHSFAPHLLAQGADIRTIQQLLGHRHLDRTMISTHVHQPAKGTVSPLDRFRRSRA